MALRDWLANPFHNWRERLQASELPRQNNASRASSDDQTAVRGTVIQDHHELMAGHSDPNVRDYHLAELDGLFDDDAMQGPGLTEPPADHYGPNGEYLGPPSPAQAKAQELQAEYFRQMTLENTPLGFYDDRYGMDDFPEGVYPAPSDAAERALLQHLREHPELRENPEWTDWYEGVDKTAGADLDQAADWPYHAHAAADVAATYRTDPNDSDNHKTAEQLWRALCATEYRSYVVAYGNDGNPRNDLPDRWAARAADLAERLSGEVEVPPDTLRSRARDAAYAYGQDPGTDDDPDRFEPPAWANLPRHDGGAAAQEDPDETAAAVHAACAAVEQVDDAAAPPPPHNSESRESAADSASVDD
ncbi:hypothetical protein [Pseudonocardia zijingensis]|uniref:Uncharacterized protein n=1 Tax=Pseudonocardia zijingensis TaxID=153376 RepID=A0ABP3YNE4_9PSEU